MDPFAIIVVVAVLLVLAVLLLIGHYYPGSGIEQIGLRSAREITESREELEAEDLDQMLNAHNARRRARGESEVSAGEIQRRVQRDVADLERRREEWLADRELDQLLEATNARRRRRGLPERTRADVRKEFGP